MMRRFFKHGRARRGGGPAHAFYGARRAFALLAVAALLNAAGPVRASESARRAAPTGQVALAAGLKVDGLPAVSGQTIFPGSSFDAAERSMLELGNRARIELSGGAALRLDFNDEGLGGTLGAGAARLSVPRGVAAALTTADASVLSVADDAARFTLEVSAAGTTLSVQAGRVEMRAGGAAKTAGAGESLRAARGSQPAAPQGNGLSGGKRAGLFVGIAAAVAAVILVLVGRGGNDDVIDQGCPLIISPGAPTNPCGPVVL